MLALAVGGQTAKDDEMDISVLAVSANYEFRTASQLARELSLPRAWVKKVVSQPGYHRGQRMCIGRNYEQGYRLYVHVGDQWMDGSLQDIVA